MPCPTRLAARPGEPASTVAEGFAIEVGNVLFDALWQLTASATQCCLLYEATLG